MNFTELKKMFHLFYLKNVKAIVLTGGEPLLRDDFEEIVKELKKYNFKIFLDTNGDFFFKYKDSISKKIDVLGLPIDFPDSSYRNENNFRTILEILNYNKNLKKRPIIRIGTVITKDNFRNLDKIGELLKNYPIDIWKIYQFTPQNLNATKNKLSLEISQKTFDDTSQKLQDIFSEFFKVVISERRDRNFAYFFVNPDGTVFMPIDGFDICREKIIGNVFDRDILDKWNKFISAENYVNNAELTFNYKF